MAHAGEFRTAAARGLAGMAIAALIVAGPACRRRVSEGGAGTVIPLTGTYAHADSGISFPEAVAGFSRTASRRYDATGRDVGIGYERRIDGSRVAATVYVFPPPRAPAGGARTPEAQFEDEILELRRDKTDLKDGRRVETAAAHGGRTVTVRSAEFEATGHRAHGPAPGGLAELLASFRAGDWHVTVRVTADLPIRDAAWRATDELLAALGLPATGLGGVAAAPAAER